MKRHILQTLIIISSAFIAFTASAQQKLMLPANPGYDQRINVIVNDKAVSADKAYGLFRNWNDFPAIGKTAVNYIYYYNDSYFGKVPMQVYIPAGYKNSQKSACIMMLHGAVGKSKFRDIDSTAATDEDIMFNVLKKENYIIIRPLGDRTKKFDWVVNRFSTWTTQ